MTWFRIEVVFVVYEFGAAVKNTIESKPSFFPVETQRSVLCCCKGVEMTEI